MLIIYLKWVVMVANVLLIDGQHRQEHVEQIAWTHREREKSFEPKFEIVQIGIISKFLFQTTAIQTCESKNNIQSKLSQKSTSEKAKSWNPTLQKNLLRSLHRLKAFLINGPPKVLLGRYLICIPCHYSTSDGVSITKLIAMKVFFCHESLVQKAD